MAGIMDPDRTCRTCHNSHPNDQPQLLSLILDEVLNLGQGMLVRVRLRQEHMFLINVQWQLGKMILY